MPSPNGRPVASPQILCASPQQVVEEIEFLRVDDEEKECLNEFLLFHTDALLADRIAPTKPGATQSPSSFPQPGLLALSPLGALETRLRSQKLSRDELRSRLDAAHKHAFGGSLAGSSPPVNSEVHALLSVVSKATASALREYARNHSEPVLELSVRTTPVVPPPPLMQTLSERFAPAPGTITCQDCGIDIHLVQLESHRGHCPMKHRRRGLHGGSAEPAACAFCSLVMPQWELEDHLALCNRRPVTAEDCVVDPKSFSDGTFTVDVEAVFGIMTTASIVSPDCLSVEIIPPSRMCALPSPCPFDLCSRPARRLQT
jgi:hypothetical protein